MRLRWEPSWRPKHLAYLAAMIAMFELAYAASHSVWRLVCIIAAVVFMGRLPVPLSKRRTSAPQDEGPPTPSEA
ncbi:hypothetical protein [Catenulispora yoronensis]